MKGSVSVAVGPAARPQFTSPALVNLFEPRSKMSPPAPWNAHSLMKTWDLSIMCWLGGWAEERFTTYQWRILKMQEGERRYHGVRQGSRSCHQIRRNHQQIRQAW